MKIQQAVPVSLPSIALPYQDRITVVHPQRKVSASSQQPLPLQIRGIQWLFKIGGQLLPNVASHQGFRLFTEPRRRAKHFRDDEVLLMARKSVFQHQGLELMRYDWGNPEHPSVALVHGWESRATALRNFVKPLLERGLHVTALDAPAHGDSPGDDLNMLSYAQLLAAYWQSLSGLEAVIAHSFGGSATVYALSHLMPNFPLDKLVTIGSPATSQMMLDSFLDFIKAPAPMRSAFYAYIEKRAGHPLHLLDYCDSNDRHQIEHVLLVHDMADPQIPFSEAIRILEHWPNAYLLATQGYGHYALTKHAAITNEIVDFVCAPAKVL